MNNSSAMSIYSSTLGHYVDIIREKVYNSINRTYTTDEVVSMDNSLLEAFFSKIDDFYKYAPKDVLEVFSREFVPEMLELSKHYNRKKLFNLLDKWFDTVDIYSNPETIADLQDSFDEIENGDTFVWKPGMFLE